MSLEPSYDNSPAHPNVLIVKESAPQMPEVPWSQWLGNLQEKFKHWTQEKEPEDPDNPPWPPEMPNLPDQHRKQFYEIPSKYDPDIVSENERIRKIIGESATGVFYRPGIGYGGALKEVLGKIGTFGSMVVTDPVYEGRDMVEWSEGILPIDYWVKTLVMIDPQDLEVRLTDDFRKPGDIIGPEQYETAEIPKRGMATITFRVNGVNLSIHLLTEDMTKFNPSQYSILGLGRPTPYNHEKADDPRFSEGFSANALRHLTVGGLVLYHDADFQPFPRILPPECLGFEIVHAGKNTIAQKREDVGSRLEQAFGIDELAMEAVRALSGAYPENKAMPFYYKEVNEYKNGDEPDITIEDVVRSYTNRLAKISEFVANLPEDVSGKVLKRLEFIFMGPIATNGEIDDEKVNKINQAPEDPDQPKPYDPNNHRGTYFGDPRGLIHKHNQGALNIFDYYDRLIQEFYTAFPQLKQSSNK